MLAEEEIRVSRTEYREWSIENGRETEKMHSVF